MAAWLEASVEPPKAELSKVDPSKGEPSKKRQQSRSRRAATRVEGISAAAAPLVASEENPGALRPSKF